MLRRSIKSQRCRSVYDLSDGLRYKIGARKSVVLRDTGTQLVEFDSDSNSDDCYQEGDSGRELSSGESGSPGGYPPSYIRKGKRKLESGDTSIRASGWDT